MNDRGDVGVAAANLAEVAALAAAVDALLALGLSRLSATQLTGLLAALEPQAGRLASVQRNVVGEIDTRGVAEEFGCASPGQLLHDQLLIDHVEARARVRAARSFSQRRTLTGEELEPVVPLVAAALAAGEVSLAHGTVIAELLDRLPGEIEAVHGIAVQEFLLEQSRLVDPKTLRQLAVRIEATLDPDGRADRERDLERRRFFRLVAHADGSSTAAGRLTPEATVVWRTVLDDLAAPAPAEDGVRDPRTPGQRVHDGLLDAGLRLLRSGELPDAGGTPVSIAVTITLDQLREQAALAAASQAADSQAADSEAATSAVGSTVGHSASPKHQAGAGTGYAQTAFGDLLPVRRLLALGDEAEIAAIVLDDAGAVLDYGRARRLASCSQRRALAARDKGCSFPGCTVPPSRCQAHHVVAWIAGGSTDIGNLVLLCGYHHREFERRGWIVTMVDGTPQWRPPSWLDPQQRL
ncbi:DUF222 domain-containing protein, partial [Jatrophihabitans sp.]|uniref:HNH endonuclease signature motif containing protein n=1 Tax=Jatrophihabitans sp. TaxID=1932789 RepID=UPI0030C769C9